MINLDAANDIPYATTQLAINSSDSPSLAWILNTNDRMLWYNRATFNIFIYTLFSKNASKSKRQFTCDQVIVIYFGYNQIIPMKYQKYFHP